ncbi:MAG: hypothetical protein LIO63_06375 [Akkermansia sp.]|nr:hypothetical protein [Akkermansia sp.]
MKKLVMTKTERPDISSSLFGVKGTGKWSSEHPFTNSLFPLVYIDVKKVCFWSEGSCAFEDFLGHCHFRAIERAGKPAVAEIHSGSLPQTPGAPAFYTGKSL